VYVQAPVPADRELAGCRFATQLKSWYDEQYNDWATRYVRERLYNRHGIDRGAVYMYTKLLPPPQALSRKRIAPAKVADDKQYIVTECKRFVHVLCWHCPRRMRRRSMKRYGVRQSVRPPIDRQQQRIGRSSRHRSIAAGAVLQAPALSSKCG